MRPTTARRSSGSGEALVEADRLFDVFRGRFVGKASPVHFFWGAFDLATTRFSGRTAPPHPGGAPNCADWVMHEAYSHEVSSCGFWPGGSEEGSFYSYAYPEPAGFADQPVQPGRRLLRRRPRRVHPPVPGGAHGGRPRCDRAGVPADDVRGGGDDRATGIARPSKRVSKVA